MMTTASQDVQAKAVPSLAPNAYHLHGEGIRVTYYPTGEGPLTVDGPVKLIYQDHHRTLTFRAHDVAVADVPSLGSLVTVVLQLTPDLGSTTATLVVPAVVLGGAQSAAVHTLLITTMHASTLTGLGDPQRDTYTVTHLTGSANNEILPL
jgi:hypothetical protein